MPKRINRSALLVAVASAALIVAMGGVQAQQPRSVPPAIDTDDIGGTVGGPSGPEAGVWVIAETSDLPTKFARIVVTDDQGRYVLPDLPTATYAVWVRGYGLVDSRRVRTRPGVTLNLTAVPAATPIAAAQYYPASYWYSLLEVPPKSAFPMRTDFAVTYRDDGRRMEPVIESQAEWIHRMKSDVQLVQIGDKATREIPEQLGRFRSSREAWAALVATPGWPMRMDWLNRDRALTMYADWTDRIAAGAVPPAPPRPTGVERNVVVTLWDWSDPKGFIHDEIATDRRNPTLNANGPIFGPEQFSSDVLNMLDPVRHAVTRLPVPTRDEGLDLDYAPTVPLAWGTETVRTARANLHNPMMDHKGRVWMTGELRRPENQPDFCKAGSTHPSAQRVPLSRNMSSGGGRQLIIYDPPTRKFTFVDTCFGTHHLQFAEDADNTLWLSGSEQVLGWVNTRVYDETGDVARAQGWCAYVLDTNGNGKADAYVGPDDPSDPSKDRRIRGSAYSNASTNGYGIIVNPVDGSIWQAVQGYPGYILRIAPGANPPETCVTEVYHNPPGTYNPKGIDVDRQTGLVWVAFASSGHFASFDRRKCRIVSGPNATGDHCPEGWTTYATPGPKFKGVDDQVNADWHYLNWVDQFNTFGLGANVPMAPGTNSDSIVMLSPGGRFNVFRVPYPMGYFARGLDGRIDDPQGGWKGRGLWSAYASIAPWHYEGGKGSTSKVVKLQLRPDPLAK